MLKNYKFCADKKCLFFEQLQPLDNFFKDKKSKNKHAFICKICSVKRESIWRALNPDKVKIRGKENYQKHKEEIKLRARASHYKNKEKNNLRAKQWKGEHKEEVREYERKKFKEDLNYRTKKALRSRLNKAIKNNLKVGSAVRDMCCSIDEMLKMFEPMYENNPFHPILGKMCRENYGKINGVSGWEIDHIIPLSAFDLTDREQFLKAVHYSNLRPMWSEQNRSEGARGMSRNKQNVT